MNMNAAHVNSTNSTNDLDCQVLDRYAILSSLVIVTGIISFFTNTVFLCAVCVNKKLQVKSKVFIINLSLADLITALIVPTFEFIYVYDYPKWKVSPLGTNIYNSVWIFSLVFPFIMAMIISLDRYFAVTYHLKYKLFMGTGKIITVVAFMWMYSIMWVVVLGYYFNTPSPFMYEWSLPRRLYVVFLAHIGVPLVFIPYINWKIFMAANRSRREVRGRRISNAEVRLAKTVLLMNVKTFLIWLPIILLEALRVYSTLPACVKRREGIFGVFFVCVNGFVNPIIYTFRNKEIVNYARTVRQFVHWHKKVSFSTVHSIATIQVQMKDGKFPSKFYC